ncbi:MAG: DNA alkylation repair protein [Candidatus Azobacteroides sp.]|nr:DNA alkylation repair protein [Candidatus Azobacteroides sp.]
MQEENLKKYIHQIKKGLRLSMNGVASTSMREKGLDYKLNFGVSIPRLKELAEEFPKEQELANYCWQSGSREMKLLSAMLQPSETFTPEMAEERMQQMPNSEIARQYVTSVFSRVPFAEKMAVSWLDATDELTRITGYLILLRLFAKGDDLSEHTEAIFPEKAWRDIDSPSFSLKKAVTDCLKRYGRRNRKYAEITFSLLEEFRNSIDLPTKEIYEDIKFDIEFYLNKGNTDSCRKE